MSRGTRLAGVAVVALLAACTPEASEGPTPVPETPTMTSQSPSPTPSPTPSPSPSPTEVQSFPPPPADETEEEAAIREGWMSYWKTYAKFLADPFVSDFTETQTVTVSQSDQARAILDSIQGLREQGWQVVGDHVLRDYKVEKPPVDDRGVRSVVVSYCYDGRFKQVVDAATGLEVETPAAEMYRETARLEEGEDGIWRVSIVSNEPAKC